MATTEARPGSADMLALVVRDRGQHEIETISRPTPGLDEALVAVGSVAMCGTDLRLLRGTLHDADYPVVPGHEWAGVVAEAPGAADLVGREVVGSNFVACGHCPQCLAGAEQLCDTLDEIGFTLQGAMAEMLCVPLQNLRPLPAGLTLAEGCLLEPLCVVVHALERAPALDGLTVGVVGAGTIGLMILQLAVAGGARTVAVADPVPARRALASELGAQAQAADVAAWEIKPDVVFDATGAAAVFPGVLESTRVGGTVVLVGYSGEESVAFAPSTIMLRELNVVGSLSGYGKLDAAIAAVDAGAVRLGPLLGPAVPLANYGAVLHVPADAAPLRSFISVAQSSPPSS